MNEQNLTRSLASLPIPQVQYYESVGSTNDVALAWLENGAVDGALVVANTQTAGRGRMSRRWVSEPGAGLAFSLVLHPTPQETQRLGLFSALGALAVCMALQDEFRIHACVKWPNDVLIGGRKVCGILPEAAWNGSALRGLVLGIGINISESALPPENELLFPATTIETVLGCSCDRITLLRIVLESLLTWRAQIDTPAFLAALNARMMYRGQAVHIEQPGGELIKGIALGFADNGELRVKPAPGQEILVVAGDLRLRPAKKKTSQPGDHLC